MASGFLCVFATDIYTAEIRTSHILVKMLKVKTFMTISLYLGKGAFLLWIVQMCTQGT